MFISLSNQIRTQFSQTVKCFQCDNGREYNNSLFHKYCVDNGLIFRFSCPHTSSQNGKAERKIHTINNMFRTLLAHSSVPPSFQHSTSNHSLFIYRRGSDMAYILLYVYDIILITSSDDLRKSIMALLAYEFAMKDLGPLSYFLGIVVTRHDDGLFLHQSTYASDIIARAGMASCKPSTTPVNTKQKLSTTANNSYDDPTLYRSTAGALQYLTFTRPDISYAVQQVCLHMHTSCTDHMLALKRILRYVQGTLHYGLHLYSSPIEKLISYTDADLGGCPDTRRSTFGYCVFLGDNLISLSSKRQPTLSRSSAEAEYMGVANVVFESCWLRNLLLELHYTFPGYFGVL